MERAPLRIMLVTDCTKPRLHIMQILSVLPKISIPYLIVYFYTFLISALLYHYVAMYSSFKALCMKLFYMSNMLSINNSLERI